MNVKTSLHTVLQTTPKYLNKLKEFNITTLEDFLYYFPRSYKDLSEFRQISDLRTDEVNTVKGKIQSIVNLRTRTGKTLTKAIFSDETGSIEVVWFNQKHLKNMIRKGDTVILSGKAQFALGKLSMASPQYELMKLDQVHTGRIVPIYPERGIITSKWVRNKIYSLIKHAKFFPESLPAEIIESEQLMSLAESMQHIHFPETREHLEKAQRRLGFEELFRLQLVALENKYEWRRAAEEKGMTIRIEKDCIKQLLETLPFSLTDAQKRAVVDILNDLKKPYPMMRLLEGDVGSGKTVVAALAAFNTIKNGYQTSLMAPTEVLAKQHFKGMLKLLTPLGVRVDFLAGSMTKKEKERIIIALKNHSIDLVVGTHALIQESVDFADLGLAIIDEQHRFGVKQRDILAGYGTPHVLSMTATPIPRTLAMTLYGDQDLTIIDELPPGRKEIVTRIVPEHKRTDAYRWVEESIRMGRQAYVICPLIDDSEAIQSKSAKKEFERLQSIFPQLKLGLLHGKMKQKDKDAIMIDFSEQKIDILISTTVIEVGIDVPNATIIMIEGAERFGLAQLHQLRGRVGRGDHQSYCFLFTTPQDDSDDQYRVSKRLKAMAQHSSGFVLAEVDLELRGPGEVYGVKQSGIPDLKMASLTDAQLVAQARAAAEKVAQNRVHRSIQ